MFSMNQVVEDFVAENVVYLELRTTPKVHKTVMWEFALLTYDLFFHFLLIEVTGNCEPESIVIIFLLWMRGRDVVYCF